MSKLNVLGIKYHRKSFGSRGKKEKPDFKEEDECISSDREVPTYFETQYGKRKKRISEDEE